MSWRRVFSVGAAGLACVALLTCVMKASHANSGETTLDPAAWGTDHVGKALPDYITGGECLFCHRDDIGPRWQADSHRATINEAPPDSPPMKALREAMGGEIAGEVAYLLGDKQRVRYLKPNGRYGQVAMLSTEWAPNRDGGELLNKGEPTWDNDLFANNCAGCHATAVDPEIKAFSGISHDCFVCHGVVPQEHTGKPELAFLAKNRHDTAALTISICAQCHIRTGKSRSTGLPYPNTFVAGDNLFKDYEVELSDEAINALNVGDRHVLQNVRDVVLYGKEDVTCITCHDIHDNSSRRHRLLKRYGMSDSCALCHTDANDWPSVRTYEVHSDRCQY